ncbi:MAG: hypothetical protein U0X20_14425 [Caldilineaceae bacterium]
MGYATLIPPYVPISPVSRQMNGTKVPAQGSSWVQSESRNQSKGRETNDAPYARVNVVWDNVDGWFGAGVTVWFTVTTPSETTVKGTGSGTAGSDGWMAATPKGCRCDMVPGDHVLVSSSAGFSALLVPIEIVGLIDVAADRVSGRMSGGTFPGAGTIWVWSEGRHQGWGRDIDIAADGLYSADFAGHFDIQVGDRAEIWYLDGNGNQVGTQLQTLNFNVNYGNDWVDVWTRPNATITVTVAGKASMQVQANADGVFYGDPSNSPWVPAQPDIQPGDVVTVESGGETSSVNPVGTIQGAVSLSQNTVSGSVRAPRSTGLLPLRCEVWTSSEDAPSIQTTVQPDGGSYVCNFGQVGWALQADQYIAVRYLLPNGNWVINVFRAPFARANIAWDSVDGWFGAGVTVWFTVTTPSETTVKGTGSGTTRSDGWMNVTLQGCSCDMVPGDHVLVSSSAGFSALLVPIEIVGLIDVAADRVSGRMSGGTFPGAGTIWAWSGNRNQGWGKDIDIAADGLYSADFAGHFDIQLGDSAEVWYLDGNGNQVGTQIEASHELQSIYLPLVKRGPH